VSKLGHGRRTPEVVGRVEKYFGDSITERLCDRLKLKYYIEI
jgi:hypothetical protein